MTTPQMVEIRTHKGPQRCEIVGQAGQWVWHRTWEPKPAHESVVWAPWTVSHVIVGDQLCMCSDEQGARDAATFAADHVQKFDVCSEWYDIPEERRQEIRASLEALGAVCKEGD